MGWIWAAQAAIALLEQWVCQPQKKEDKQLFFMNISFKPTPYLRQVGLAVLRHQHATAQPAEKCTARLELHLLTFQQCAEY
ncbi:hypothetical protein [Chitinibacter tainanensis]|uniref:hypothetical protein n=1 Tax=Chitinibacter tainanensis TaxID=230667 RepID=UPI002352E9BB|nr:hypothetical protein [Chitinibacter tainanensis]